MTGLRKDSSQKAIFNQTNRKMTIAEMTNFTITGIFLQEALVFWQGLRILMLPLFNGLYHNVVRINVVVKRVFIKL